MHEGEGDRKEEGGGSNSNNKRELEFDERGGSPLLSHSLLPLTPKLVQKKTKTKTNKK